MENCGEITTFMINMRIELHIYFHLLSIVVETVLFLLYFHSIKYALLSEN